MWPVHMYLYLAHRYMYQCTCLPVRRVGPHTPVDLTEKVNMFTFKDCYISSLQFDLSLNIAFQQGPL